MFKRLSSAFSSAYSTFSSHITGLFKEKGINQTEIIELEKILLQADTGVATTQKIISLLKKSDLDDSKVALSNILTDLLSRASYKEDEQVIVLVGINGGGKTTSAAKLATLFKHHNKKVLLAAADTFRAAAVDQLKIWSEKCSIPLITGTPQQDPSAVVYQACAEYKKNNYDTLIIDTAGRLQTKTHLMKELEKIYKTIHKQLPEKKVTMLLVVDSMLGQNSLDQVKLFNESTKLDGIILTKTDGTGKGGIIFSIVDTLNIPIAYVTFGEQADQIARFNAQEFVSSLTQ